MSKTKQLNNQIKTIDVIEKVTKILQISATVKARDLVRKQNLALGHKNFFTNELSKASLQEVLSSKKSGKSIVLAISSPKSMCGSLNNEVIKNTINIIDANPDEVFEIYTYCDKGEKLISKRTIGKNVSSVESVSVKKEVHISQKDLQKYVDKIYNELLSGDVKNIFIVYPYAKSLLSQFVVSETLFPLQNSNDVVYESYQVDADIKKTILKSYLNSYIHYAVSACLTAVNYSRMMVTDNANKNSQSKKQELKKIFNNTRQSKITSELIDIVSGSNAL